MSQMLKSSGAMSAATMLSRLLGLGREMAYAAFMGAGWVADAFTLAYMVPNLFRRLLGEGALTAAFIPIFKEKEKTAGEQEMWHAANAVVSGLTFGTACVVALGMLAVTGLLAMQLPAISALALGATLAAAVPWLAGVAKSFRPGHTLYSPLMSLAPAMPLLPASLQDSWKTGLWRRR
jgi:peptidoglycan biosynthesis protein MviN/MurJ (putative lipid II flippase)